MNNRGSVVGITVLSLLSVFFIVMFYIILQMYSFTSEPVFELLANVPNGSLIRILIEFLPLIFIILFVVIVITIGTKSRVSEYAG